MKIDARTLSHFSMGDPRMCFNVFFEEGKIDDVDLHTHFINFCFQVVRLDISINKRLCINVFDSIDNLICKK